MPGKEKVAEELGNNGIIPAVRIEELKDAVPIAAALIDGGLSAAEITFRTDAAEDAIKAVRKNIPGMIMGAGTIINAAQARKALDAGAQFIVTPGLDRETVELCKGEDILIIPGVSTPTEVQQALAMGVDILKFFPAEALGGLKTLKAISAPLFGARFVPLGGINTDNLKQYLSFPKVFACGGTWMVKDELIRAGRFDGITSLVREAVDVMLGFELAHVGINAGNSTESIEIANSFSSFFNSPAKEGSSSNFSGSFIKVCKSKGPGANGHIAVRTNSLKRAKYFLEKRGCAVDVSTAEKNSEGVASSVYLKGEIGGFAITLLQK